LKTPLSEFFVRSKEQNFCPCCGGVLTVIGSRKRGFLQATGEKKILIIRRLNCAVCERVHHELPDILVPYKRYDSESIEKVIGGGKAINVAADESTLSRWKRWFKELCAYLLGALISLTISHFKNAVEPKPELPNSALPRIWCYVGEGSGWLARVVRPVVNTNIWVQTRSAFLSG